MRMLVGSVITTRSGRKLVLVDDVLPAESVAVFLLDRAGDIEP